MADNMYMNIEKVKDQVCSYICSTIQIDIQSMNYTAKLQPFLAADPSARGFVVVLRLQPVVQAV